MIFACIWSIGATSDTDSRVKFDFFLRELLKGKLPEYQFPDSVQKTDISMAENGLVYDHFFDVCLKKLILL